MTDLTEHDCGCSPRERLYERLIECVENDGEEYESLRRLSVQLRVWLSRYVLVPTSTSTVCLLVPVVVGETITTLNVFSLLHHRLLFVIPYSAISPN